MKVELPEAQGVPRARGRIRVEPEDFVVREELGFEPGGGGEHLWLRIRKVGWNTLDLALWLARAAGLPLRGVGFSGLKDRNAETEQWFSLHLPGRPDPAFGELPAGLTLLEAVRHGRKLNRGTHRRNRFRLRVRNLVAADDLPHRLALIRERGVPNYFGEQRFGREQRNLVRGAAWLEGQGEAPRKQNLRGLWLSAVRSGLFNAVLAERVRQGVWDSLLNGDICQPRDSRGLFLADGDSDAGTRVARGEIHPTAPLPGRDGMAPAGACAALEEQVLAPWKEVVAGLQREGVEGARRATRLWVEALEWDLGDDRLELEFRLPAGAFATAVLAELIRADQNDGPTGPAD